jgi:phosphate transport system permease protein
MSMALSSLPHPGPRKDAAMAARLGRSRQRKDRIIRTLCIAATVVGLVLLASILATLFYRGFEAMSLRVFTHVTAPPGSEGGLLNAIRHAGWHLFGRIRQGFLAG